MTEQAPDERHTISIFMGILDSETLKHTIHFQGMKKSVTELKRKVMEFVNLTMPSKNDPMDLGRVEHESDEEWHDEQTEVYEDGYLNGLGEKCYNCGGYGHYSRECPVIGK